MEQLNMLIRLLGIKIWLKGREVSENDKNEYF